MRRGREGGRERERKRRERERREGARDKEINTNKLCLPLIPDRKQLARKKERMQGLYIVYII